MTDEENDRPAWGKRDPLEVEAMDLARGNMDDNYAAAQRRYDRQEPEDFPTLGDPLESTLAQQLADWVEAGGRERIVAVIDFILDEHRLYERDDPLKTFQQWIDKGTGPRDFDYERFDAQR